MHAGRRPDPCLPLPSVMECCEGFAVRFLARTKLSDTFIRCTYSEHKGVLVLSSQQKHQSVPFASLSSGVAQDLRNDRRALPYFVPHRPMLKCLLAACRYSHSPHNEYHPKKTLIITGLHLAQATVFSLLTPTANYASRSLLHRFTQIVCNVRLCLPNA